MTAQPGRNTVINDGEANETPSPQTVAMCSVLDAQLTMERIADTLGEVANTFSAFVRNPQAATPESLRHLENMTRAMQGEANRAAKAAGIALDRLDAIRQAAEQYEAVQYTH